MMLSVSGGTDKFSAYASASYSMAEGVVPNDYRGQDEFFIERYI